MFDLDGDTDWDGRVSDSDEEERLEESHHVFVLNNCDRDSPDRTKGPDNQDDVINEGNDRGNDLAEVIIRPMLRAPGGRLSLRLRQVSKEDGPPEGLVRIFLEDRPVLGPGRGAEYEFTASQVRRLENEKLTLLAEGLQFAASVRLELCLDGEAKAALTLECAPFILTPHNLDATENVVVHNGQNDDFVKRFQEISREIGVKTEVVECRDVWVQDEVQWGFTQLPARSVLPVVLHMKRSWDDLRDQNLYGYAEGLLKKDRGYFKAFGYGQPSSSLDYGGNIEVTPPTREYPFGRIYFGSIRSRNTADDRYQSRGLDPEFVRFFRRQKVQEPIELATDWLEVGHVDEILSFVPVGKDRFLLLLASPRLALALLEDAGRATHLVANYEKYGARTYADLIGGGVPGQKIHFLNRDPSYYNLAVDRKIYGDRSGDGRGSIKAQLVDALKLREEDVIEVPVLFWNQTPGVTWSAVAMTPGLVNLMSLGKTSVFPAPFIPEFRDDLVASLAVYGHSAKFLNDWDNYHCNLGEVHCGSNEVRKPFEQTWWEYRYPSRVKAGGGP